jgi:DNA (cytosine-5)-methyltransferase 1
MNINTNINNHSVADSAGVSAGDSVGDSAGNSVGDSVGGHLDDNINLGNAISLFSGCGGDSEGMRSAGMNVLLHVEKDKNCIQSLNANYNPQHVLHTDISKMNKHDVFSKYTNNINLIFAGFPCQGFSHAGRKDPNDNRNRLFYDFKDITNIVKPIFVFGENVKGIMSRKDPDGIPVVNRIINEFDEIGYHMEAKLYCMTTFGVPQLRKRVLFVGVRKDFKDAHNFQFNWPTNNSNPNLSLRNIITDDINNSILIDDNIILNNRNKSITFKNTRKRKPDGTPHPYVINRVNAKQLSFGVRASPTHAEIVDLDKSCKTIISTYQRMPRLFVGLKNSHRPPKAYIRTFNPYELKQIQGFPIDYKIEGAMKSHQIGNAVPPPAVKIIIQTMMKPYL